MAIDILKATEEARSEIDIQCSWRVFNLKLYIHQKNITFKNLDVINI